VSRDLFFVVFFLGPLLDVVAAFFNRSRIQDVNPRSFSPGSIEFRRLSKFLATVAVDATYNPDGKRKYKIKHLHGNNAEATKFTQQDKTIVNVKDYFFRTYNVRLQYPHLPLVACGSNGQILLPMEICAVRPGQRHIGKLSDAQTADVIKIAAIPPMDRQKRVADGRE
jgi:eukaryotic translation initiation factor 2C